MIYDMQVIRTSHENILYPGNHMKPKKLIL
jgi:hypothetical protein